MTRQLVVTPVATDDVEEIAMYIGRGSPQSSERLIQAVDRAYNLLVETPGAGPRVPKRHHKLRGLRKWPIHRFLNYIVFYRVHDDRLEIVRVLHGARDVYRILQDET